MSMLTFQQTDTNGGVTVLDNVRRSLDAEEMELDMSKSHLNTASRLLEEKEQQVKKLRKTLLADLVRVILNSFICYASIYC